MLHTFHRSRLAQHYYRLHSFLLHQPRHMRKGVLLKDVCFRTVVACLYAAFFIAHLLAITPDTPRQPGTLPYFSYQTATHKNTGISIEQSGPISPQALNFRLNKRYHPEEWTFIPVAGIAYTYFFPVPEKKWGTYFPATRTTHFRVSLQLRGPPAEA